ncbi:MAG: ATP-binding protein [Deltaproteobacteria bacterium]|nr:ATP-binding protein [Deltaproteobacteria bacterium]
MGRGLPEVWNEATLRAISPGEHDFQEFKSSPWIEDNGEIGASFLSLYSKQLSAFANGAGGRLLIGIDDHGRIDGGVRTDLKSGGLRGWLEDVTPGAIDPPLSGFNVFEVRSDASEKSMIGPGRAVYVVEIPASESAPHQAIDHRYYLRIAGKSRPMGHVHIQDVLRRTRHPRVVLERLGPFGEPEFDEGDPRGPRVLISLRAFVKNTGPTMAHHVGGEIILPRMFVNSEARKRMLAYDGIRLTQTPGDLAFFKYYPTPLFPTQQSFFQRIWIALHAGNRGMVQGERGQVRWSIYADDAPPLAGADDLWRFKVVRRASRWLDAALRRRAAESGRS